MPLLAPSFPIPAVLRLEHRGRQLRALAETSWRCTRAAAEWNAVVEVQRIVADEGVDSGQPVAVANCIAAGDVAVANDVVGVGAAARRLAFESDRRLRRSRCSSRTE